MFHIVDPSIFGCLGQGKITLKEFLTDLGITLDDCRKALEVNEKQDDLDRLISDGADMAEMSVSAVDIIPIAQAIGFAIIHKEVERRRAEHPVDIKKIVGDDDAT